ncbi:MAG: tryptophan synthase subunit alpha [Actinomycetota bacterium]|nr:tryptophan synthase subunit alpha [Actinomycetota bacterium]
MSALSEGLDEARRDGRKLLVPYVMGGQPERESFSHVLTAVGRAADAVEVGLPYSDPLMDGPVIAAAGERSIRAGVGPSEALELVAETDLDVPTVAMTYYNPIHSVGEDGFCAAAAKAGLSGLIVPDLPLEESEGLRRSAAEEGLAWIPLVAPTSSPARVEAIAASATGFVYAVSTLGVTGTREQLSERAAAVASACKEATDLAVLVGIGVSSPEHARAAALYSDGVVVGSAVVGLVSESGAEGAAAFLADVRAALDAQTT